MELLAVTILVVVAGTVAHAYWFPFQRCPGCMGRSGRGAGSTPRAYNRCRKCGGKGERVRPVTRLLNKTAGMPVRQNKR